MFRDRIKDFRRIKASSLISNPKNWRDHPPQQRTALNELLDGIGIAGALIARETPEDIADDIEWPVLVLDVDQAEADLLLATIDPLAALAEANQEQLNLLLDDIQTDSEQLQILLNDLKHSANVLTIPDEFNELDESISTEYCCPKCGYSWSGGSS